MQAKRDPFIPCELVRQLLPTAQHAAPGSEVIRVPHGRAREEIAQVQKLIRSGGCRAFHGLQPAIEESKRLLVFLALD